MTLKPTVGGGAASSGACGPPSADDDDVYYYIRWRLIWPVLRRLPWPRRFLAKAIRGPEPGAQVLEPLHLTPALGAPTGRPSTLVFLSVCLEVTVTSLPPPRLCRIAVFSIKPTFLSKTSSGKLSS